MFWISPAGFLLSLHSNRWSEKVHSVHDKLHHDLFHYYRKEIQEIKNKLPFLLWSKQAKLLLAKSCLHLHTPSFLSIKHSHLCLPPPGLLVYLSDSTHFLRPCSKPPLPGRFPRVFQSGPSTPKTHMLFTPKSSYSALSRILIMGGLPSHTGFLDFSWERGCILILWKFLWDLELKGIQLPFGGKSYRFK